VEGARSEATSKGDAQSEGREMRERDIVDIAAIMRLDPDKGALLLLKGLSHIENVCNRVEVKIAGEGDMREDLVRAARELGLGSCVEFLGPLNVNGVRRLLTQSHIFVNPTTYPLTTWGIANLEAMAAGLATIAYAVGGTKEYLEDGVNCIVPQPSGRGLALEIER